MSTAPETDEPLVLLSDPRIAATAVGDSGEPLVDLRDVPELRLDGRQATEASKFASPVEVAPHTTGGVVDLTLSTEEGVELDMGTAVDATPEASANACFTAARGVPDAARENRRILGRAVEGAGLVNYPTEWWHWSFGDRYWAFVTGASQSRYGPVGLTVAGGSAS